MHLPAWESWAVKRSESHWGNPSKKCHWASTSGSVVYTCACEDLRNMCPGCTYCSSIQPCTFFMPREAAAQHPCIPSRLAAPSKPLPLHGNLTQGVTVMYGWVPGQPTKRGSLCY